MNSLTSKNNTGFTLLETLVAIAILTVALGAAFGVAQKSLKTSNLAKTQTVAVYLASEGLELVRNVRDNVALYNNANSTQINWLQPFIDKCGGAIDACVYDIDPGSTGLNVTNTGVLSDAAAIKTNNSPDCDATNGCHLKIVGVTADQPTYYTSGSKGSGYSLYSRKIRITSNEVLNNGVEEKEAIVTVTVTWLDQTFALTESFHNWQQISAN